MSDLPAVGSRWEFGGREVTVKATGPRLSWGPGEYVCAVPERTLEQRRAVSGPTLKEGQAHFTDWIPARTFARKAVGPLVEGQKIEPQLPRKVRVEERVSEAVAAARSKRKPLDTGQRLKNRINSARYKLKHPEKYGRSKWTKPEKLEIEETIKAAQADLAASKGGK